MERKNRCFFCGSIHIKYIILFFVQCEDCGEAQGLQDLIFESEIPLNKRDKKRR